MAKKTLAENAAIDFKNQLDELQNITDWKDKELAEVLGCTDRTITNMRKDPFSVAGEWILKVQRHLLEADMDRNGYKRYAR